MKKTKLLTSLAALALVACLGACEAGDININVGDIGIGGSSSDTEDTEEPSESSSSSETESGEPSESSSSGDTTPEEPPVTYTYSIEVENGETLTLSYDGALEAQQGVELSIKLVTTPSTGEETKETATADDLTFTVLDPTVVTVSGLTVLPLGGGETSITIAWGSYATASVGVTVTDVTVYGPTSWDEYITNEYDRGVIADFLGSLELLDELLPFYLGDTNPTVTTGNSVSGQRLIITYNSATSTTLSTWVSLLEAAGWEQTGHTQSYNEVYTFAKDGYTVEVNLEFGSLYLYLYLPVEEPEPASTWDEFITNTAYRESIASLFGSVAALDEFLPFYGDTEPTSIVTGTHYSKGSRLVITYNSNILATWVSLLTEAGWTQTDHQVTYEETYTFEKDGYTVDLELEYGTLYVYLYPKADTGDEGGEDLETAQAILDAAATQTNGYQGFDNLHFVGQCSESGYAGYTTTLTADLTVDENNYLYGRCQWVSSDEPGPRIRYYYNDNTKYYYDNMSSNGNHSYTAAAQSNGTGERTINGILSTRLNAVGISSSNYDRAFANVSSIDLASASDLALDTETNGNYKLTFIFNDIWYCYKADTNLNLVGAGYSSNWTDATTFEIVYGEETTRAAIDAIMEADFFSVEVWFPKESGDTEEDIANAILESVQGSTPNWTAFYGEAVDTYDGELTSYLTLDSNGALFGYIDSDEWDDETYTYYFYNGYRCMYNASGVAQEPKEITTTFEGELELYIAGLSVSFNLATDSYELSEVNGGYTLEITHSNVKYTFTVDASYNLLALEREQLLGSSSDYVDSSYVEGITYADVEAALANTDFVVEDFFGEQGGDEQGGDEPTPEEGYTISDYIAALTATGFNLNYGDGFSFSQQSLDISSGLEYDSLEIEALNNNVGWASQGHYDSNSGYYASEFYSDGTNTYMYDGEDVENAGSGYGYWYYKYMTSAYFDTDTILEQLNSLGEGADCSDSDNVITDDYLYLYAYTSDYTAMVEMYVAYDETGITTLVYSYGTTTYTYLLQFSACDSVTTPEWYVPDTSAGEDNPLAAIAGSYTGTSGAGATLTLELNEDGTGTYDGTTAINWSFDGTVVYFEINYGDPVTLVWDAETKTLTGTWYQDYEYDISLSFTKDEIDAGDTQEETINLVGVWTGSGTYSNTYTVTINADGTYELVLPGATYTGTWTGSADGTIELDASSTIFEYFTLTYDADKDTALVNFEDDDYNDYTNVVYTRIG